MAYNIGKNVRAKIEDGRYLVLQIDLDINVGTSSTGKSELVATTSGNVKVPEAENVMLGLNIFRPKNQ